MLPDTLRCTVKRRNGDKFSKRFNCSWMSLLCILSDGALLSIRDDGVRPYLRKTYCSFTANKSYSISEEFFLAKVQTRHRCFSTPLHPTPISPINNTSTFQNFYRFNQIYDATRLRLRSFIILHTSQDLSAV